MQIFKKIFLIVLSLFVFTGCILINDKNTINKPLILDNTLQSKKNQLDCKKNIKIINYAFSYVLTEFEKGYFQEQNILGAKAQLFLIKNKSKSIFAQNINAAEKSYTLQYQKAKKQKCNLDKFTTSPLQKIYNIINELDTKNETVMSK